MKKQNILFITITGMLIALEVILAFTPIGYLRIGLLSITFMTIPVIIGSTVSGVPVGTVLGLVFGVTSFAQCFGMDAFGTALFTINPVYTFIMCIVTRTLMGCLCALIFKALSKTKLNKTLQYGISAFSAPFLNTVFFMFCLIAFFWKTDYIQSLAEGANIFGFLIAMVGINGIIEWVVCTVVGTLIAMPVDKAIKKSADIK